MRCSASPEKFTESFEERDRPRSKMTLIRDGMQDSVDYVASKTYVRADLSCRRQSESKQENEIDISAAR